MTLGVGRVTIVIGGNFMIYKKLDLFDFRHEFIKASLDVYSSEGYIKLFEWLEYMIAEGRFIDDIFELDVEHITDNFIELTREEMCQKFRFIITSDMFRTIDNVVERLESHTTIIWLDENKSRGIVQVF